MTNKASNVTFFCLFAFYQTSRTKGEFVRILESVLVFAAFRYTTERNEVEAGRKPGQLPSYPTAVSFCSAVVLNPKRSPQLKKDRGTSSFRQGSRVCRNDCKACGWCKHSMEMNHIDVWFSTMPVCHNNVHALESIFQVFLDLCLKFLILFWILSQTEIMSTLSYLFG